MSDPRRRGSWLKLPTFPTAPKPGGEGEGGPLTAPGNSDA